MASSFSISDHCSNASVTRQPIQRHISHSIGVVAGNRLALAIDVEVGVVVFTLALVCNPIVKTWTTTVIALTHMPFANIGRTVTRILKQQRKTLQLVRVVCEVIANAVCMGIGSGQKRSATRRAQRSRCKHVVEPGTFGCQSIDIRSFNPQQ